MPTSVPSSPSDRSDLLKALVFFILAAAWAWVLAQVTGDSYVDIAVAFVPAAILMGFAVFFFTRIRRRRFQRQAEQVAAWIDRKEH